MDQRPGRLERAVTTLRVCDSHVEDAKRDGYQRAGRADDPWRR